MGKISKTSFDDGDGDGDEDTDTQEEHLTLLSRSRAGDKPCITFRQKPSFVERTEREKDKVCTN